MKKSIIVEGFDGGGKSTLAKDIAKHYGMNLHTIGGPPLNDEEAIRHCAEQVRKIEAGIVMDRCTPISRICYEKTLHPLHTFQLTRYLQQMLEYTLIIWCVPNQYQPTEKPYDTVDHMKRIRDEQDRIRTTYAVMMLEVPHIRYNFQTDSVSYAIHQIEKGYIT